jgi:hypothetical protein
MQIFHIVELWISQSAVCKIDLDVLIVAYLFGTILEFAWETGTPENSCQGSQYSGRVCNPLPPEYKFTTALTYAVYGEAGSVSLAFISGPNKHDRSFCYGDPSW